MVYCVPPDITFQKPALLLACCVNQLDVSFQIFLIALADLVRLAIMFQEVNMNLYVLFNVAAFSAVLIEAVKLTVAELNVLVVSRSNDPRLHFQV